MSSSVFNTKVIFVVAWALAMIISMSPLALAFQQPSPCHLRTVPMSNTAVLSSAAAQNVQSVATATNNTSASNDNNDVDEKDERVLRKLQGKLLKNLRQVAKDYKMLEEGDHIMVAVSGGKDSATLLYLLQILQSKLPINFDITAVHVDQKQPGYDGTTLVDWLQEDLKVPYQVIEEDTYSIVVDKTEPGKSFCTLCSRLRRGILSSTAIQLGCNKIALGHHADDAAETMFLNMIHSGQMKGMPARYTSKRGSLGVLRPLMYCFEEDIARYAALKQFPILPCNLCSNQANLQRPQIKLLLDTLQGLNPMAKKNILSAMSDIRPSHLLDQNLRENCGMDPITGDEEDNGNET
mmetsp:Transcript_31988/g.77823  ORF Transcript_31988/g.77823 Transcript_31988/m.77823 type:complete len:351 (+) Transcript_31988:185-1237(+)